MIEDLSNGRYKIPGVIDCHVHFREPGGEWKEDFASGSRAAAAGGVTMVLDMPNTNPPVITQEILDAKRVLADEKSVIPVGLFFAATDNLQELETVEGVVGFKVYMGKSTGELLAEGGSLRRIFEIARDRDLPVVVHAEDEERIRARAAEFAERTEPRVHCLVRDNECARLAVEAALKLREEVGNRLHIAHMSTAEEVMLVRAHKCQELSCEVAPHHLFFTMDDMVDSKLKMNPPLRSQKDQDALWAAIVDGTVNCISTDHAPHTLEEKLQGIWDAPAGVPGVEFMLPLMLNAVSEGRLTLERLVELVCIEPARIFRLQNQIANASAIVDMNITKTITRDMVKSKCGWSPYEGRTLKGWPV